MNVLIVDDDKLARKGLIAIMDWEKYGFKVAGDVQNGRKALECHDLISLSCLNLVISL